MNPYVEISASSIHGLGLIAKTDIKKNTKICDYYGEEMTLSEFKIRYGKYADNSLYTYRMKRLNKIIVAKEEPYKTANLVNYINECDEPNCVLKKRALYTTRDVVCGEELCVKYPNDYKRDY